MNGRDIFYDTDGLMPPELEALLRKAHSICENWWMDKLDCSVSFARQRVPDVSFEEAMRHFREAALVNVIHRQQIIPACGPHLEVSFSSMEHPVDYFLWIIVPLERAAEIVAELPVRS